MESADCVAAAGSLRSGVRLPSLGRDFDRVVFGGRGSFIHDSMCPLTYGPEMAIKETLPGCF